MHQRDNITALARVLGALCVCFGLVACDEHFHTTAPISADDYALSAEISANLRVHGANGDRLSEFTGPRVIWTSTPSWSISRGSITQAKRTLIPRFGEADAASAPMSSIRSENRQVSKRLLSATRDGHEYGIHVSHLDLGRLSFPTRILITRDGKPERTFRPRYALVRGRRVLVGINADVFDSDGHSALSISLDAHGLGRQLSLRRVRHTARDVLDGLFSVRQLQAATLGGPEWCREYEDELVAAEIKAAKSAIEALGADALCDASPAACPEAAKADADAIADALELTRKWDQWMGCISSYGPPQTISPVVVTATVDCYDFSFWEWVDDPTYPEGGYSNLWTWTECFDPPYAALHDR